MGELADVLLEVNSGKPDATVFAHDCRILSRELDLDMSVFAHWLVELRYLVVLRHVRIKVVLSIPLAYLCDIASEQ